MPTHRIQGPDGKIHRIEAPADADPQQLVAFLASKLAPAEEPGFFDIAQSYTTDIPVRAVKGALGGVESITNIFGADNDVSQFLEGAQETINEYLVSDTAKQRAVKRGKRLEGKGFLGTLAEVPGILKDDPALIFEVLGSAAPVVAATALTGGAGAIAQGAAVLGTGAAMGVGTTKESIFDATKSEFLKAGVSEEEAEAAADEAQSYLGKNADMIALGGALGALASRTGLEPAAARMIAGRIVGKSVSQSAGREAMEEALKAAAKKGALRTGAVEAATEGAQGAQETLAGNLARRREGSDVDLMEGVGQAAALEGTLGGIAGSAVGVLGKSDAVTQGAELEAERVAEERATRPSIFRAPEDFSRKDVKKAIVTAAGPDAPFEAMQIAKSVERKLNNDFGEGTPEKIASAEKFIQDTYDRLDAGEITKASIDPLKRVLKTAKSIVGDYKRTVFNVEPVAPVEEVGGSADTDSPNVNIIAPTIEEATPPTPTQNAPTAIWASGDFDYNVDILPDEPVKGPEDRMYQRVSYEGKDTYVPADQLRFEQVTPPPVAPIEPTAAPIEPAAAPIEPTAAPPVVTPPPAPTTPPPAAIPVRNAAEFQGASRVLVTMNNAFENSKNIDDVMRAGTGMDVLPEGLSLEASMTPLKAKQSGMGKLMERNYVAPLMENIKNSGVSLQDLGMYLLARAAPARNAMVRQKNPDFPEGGSGIDDAEAGAILEDIEARGLTGKMNRITKMHDKFVDDLLAMRVDAGLLSSEEAISLRKAQPMYTPFKGFSGDGDLTSDITEDRDSQVNAYKKASGNLRLKEFMETRGRDSLPFHPLFSLISDAESLARRVPQNEAGNTVLNMLEASPQLMSQFVSGVYTDFRPETERRMGKMVPMNMKSEVSKRPNDYLVVKKDGKTKYLKYNTNTDGGKALQEMFVALNPEQLEGFMKAWSGVNNALKSLLTYRNPLYLAGVAPLRDITDAVATAFAAQNVKGSPAFKKKLGLKVLKYSAPMSGTWSLVTRFVNNKPAPAGREADMAMLERMLAAGGAPMQLMFQTTEDNAVKMRKEFQRYAARKKGDAIAAGLDGVAAVTNVLDAWADINDLIPRYATFRAAVEEGLTDAQAAALSLDSSLNLTRRGTMTRITDNVAPFFSAGFEGSRKFVRIVKNPRSLFKVAGSLVMLGVIESLMNAEMTDDENKDGTPDYLDVSKGTRMSRLVFFYGAGGDDHVDIPIGHMLGYMKYVGNKIADTALGISSSEEASAAILGAGWDLTGGLFSLLSPARVQGGDLATSLTSLMPLGIKPFVEAVNNKNFFGTPIYTEHRENSGPASELGRNSTGAVWKSLAKAMNEVTLGGPATSGYVDFQPEVYEHIFDSLLGGAYDLITQTLKTVDDPKSTNVPVLQGFLGKGFDYVPQTKYKKNTAILMQWKSRIDNMTPEQIQKEFAKRKLDADPVVVEAFNTTEKEIGKLMRERKEVLGLAKTQEEQQAVGDYYRAKINEYQSAFNYVYDMKRKEKDKE